MRQIVEIARQTLLALIGSLVLFCGSALAAAPEPTYDQAVYDSWKATWDESCANTYWMLNCGQIVAYGEAPKGQSLVCPGASTPLPGAGRCYVYYADKISSFGGGKVRVNTFWWQPTVCPPGWTFQGGGFSGASGSCTGGPPAQIAFASGGSRTKALVAGPVLPHTVLVTEGGAPAAGKAVAIRMSSGGSVSGSTDASGLFAFVYTPPRRGTVDHLTATCGDCANTAEKDITVDSCDVCEDKKGNPISISTGEKEQTEADWQDAGVHSLSFTRHYRSYGNLPFGLGVNWSHGFMATISKEDLQAAVRFGDGTKVLFRRDTQATPWIADNRKDGLGETGTGITYMRASDESRWQFDAAGKLQTITQRNGWAMTLAYDAAGQLISITNAFGRSLQLAYSAGGQLTGITTPDNKTIAYGYDAQGRLATVTYPGAASRSYAYEDSRWPNALTGITDEAGVRYASFAYDGSGRATSTEHTGGAQNYSVSYPTGGAASGSLSVGSTVDPAVYRTTAQITDPLGNAQTYTYQGGDGNVRLLGASGAFEGGQVASRGFVGSTTLPESETDFLGVTTLFTWDGARQLKTGVTTAANRPESQTRSTQWHTSFRLPVLITEPGKTTAYAYDSLGNKLSEVLTDTQTGQNRSQGWTYNAQGLADTYTDTLGEVWRYGYDNTGNRTSVIDPLNQETRNTFDGAGRVLTQSSPGRPTRVSTWDVRGRLLSQAAGSDSVVCTYTPSGQLTSAALSDGLQVTFLYDAAQRLIGAADNRGASVQYTLDAAGNRVREEVKDANGNIALVTARIINSLNKVAAIQGSVGQTTALGYDANGEAISATDPLNQTTRQTLDGLRRTTATTFADNASAGQAWNQLDQLTQVTDPKGVATQYVYNAFGEVMSETSPDIGTIRYTRDAAGQVTGIEDAKHQISSITRDALGRPTEIRYAPDPAAFFQYNGAGDVMRIDDKSGATVYERDENGRVTAKTQDVNDNPTSPSRFKVQYGYTAGNLTSVIYPSGLKVFYKRDKGRVTGIDVQEPGGTVKKPKPIVALVSNLTHTALGVPRAWNWSSGDSASRSFDTDGRMSGNEFASYQFDAASRITGITQSLWAQRTVTQTVGTTTTTITQLYQTPLSWQAGYDNRNRVSSFVRDGAETRYSYDNNSNRLTAIDKVTSDTDLDGIFEGDDFTQITSQALNVDGASNKLLGFTQTITKTNAGKTKSVATTPVAYAVDANGAMTSDGLREFQYGPDNKLAKVRVFKNGEAASVGYLTNALSQRVFKGEPVADQTLPNETVLGADFITWLKKSFGWMFTQAAANTSIGTAYLYGDGEIPGWAVLSEYDNGSATGKGRSEYVWLPTEDGGAIPIAIYRGSQFLAVHTDHIGTPRLITNQANKPVWQWPYSAFGNNKPTGILRATPNSKAAITNKPVLLKATAPQQESNLRFEGQYCDEESALCFNGHRYYHPLNGAYSQMDPTGLAAGFNRRGYVDGNPFSYTDALGLVKKQKASSKHCQDIRRKVENLKKEMDDRWRELGQDPLGLPERIGPGEMLSETKRGHRTLINTYDQRLRNREKQYDDECEPDDDTGGSNGCDECTAGAVATTMVGGYLLYRCLRMVPSVVIPWLWPTIPANALAP